MILERKPLMHLPDIEPRSAYPKPFTVLNEPIWLTFQAQSITTVH